MDSHIDLDLLDRYLAGTCDPEERRTVERWLAADPTRTLAGLTGEVAYPEGLGDADVVWQRVYATIHAVRHAPDRRPMHEPSRWPHRRESRPNESSRPDVGRARWLFGTVGLVTVAVVGWLVVGRRPFSGILTMRHPVATRTYATAAGERATVTLPDGSRVLLGPATRVTVGGSVGDGSNDTGLAVNVTGEALFTVAHHVATAFRVRAGNADVRVLGTAFVVRRYAEDRTTHVLVTDGRVMLRSLRSERTVVPGAVLAARMLGVVDDSGGVQVTPNVDLEDSSPLVAGRLVFHQTAIRDVVRELSRAYGTEIHIADSTLASATVSWNCVVTSQSLDRVLRELVLLVDAHYIRSGHTVMIVPGPSSRPPTPSLSLTLEHQYGR
jgi:ferric-dicitrate binding protein FerR (iron transport regulator)